MILRAFEDLRISLGGEPSRDVYYEGVVNEGSRSPSRLRYATNNSHLPSRCPSPSPSGGPAQLAMQNSEPSPGKSDINGHGPGLGQQFHGLTLKPGNQFSSASQRSHHDP